MVCAATASAPTPTANRESRRTNVTWSRAAGETVPAATEARMAAPVSTWIGGDGELAGDARAARATGAGGGGGARPTADASGGGCGDAGAGAGCTPARSLTSQ